MTEDGIGTLSHRRGTAESAIRSSGAVLDFVRVGKSRCLSSCVAVARAQYTSYIYYAWAGLMLNEFRDITVIFNPT